MRWPRYSLLIGAIGIAVTGTILIVSCQQQAPPVNNNNSSPGNTTDDSPPTNDNGSGDPSGEPAQAITVNDPARSVEVNLPTLGREATIDRHEPNDGSVMLDVKARSPIDNEFVSQYSLVLWPNPTRLSLQEWFLANADEGSIILASDALTRETLPNGIQVFLITGELPDNYEGGPIAPVFARSKSGNTIMVLATSQENDLNQLGYSHAEQLSLLRSVLLDIQVP